MKKEIQTIKNISMSYKDFTFWLKGLLATYKGKNALLLLIKSKLNEVKDEQWQEIQKIFPENLYNPINPNSPTVVMYGCGMNDFKTIYQSGSTQQNTSNEQDH